MISAERGHRGEPELRPRIRFDRNELAGAFGDIGTDLPLIIGMILASGLHSSSVLVMFGLATIYDRDDQRNAAFEVLDKLQAGLPREEYAPRVQRVLATMRFAPAEDQQYYRALLFESVGDYTEARAEWALYAATSDAPWRARALQHVAAIDAQRRAAPGSKQPVPAASSTIRLNGNSGTP